MPATLAARVRVLGSGRSNKNDSNDALSVAIAALHAPRLARVGRRRSFGRVAAAREAQQRSGSGPEPDRVSAPRAVGRARAGRNPQGNQREAARSGSSHGRRPTSPVERARHAFACEHLEDLRRFDEQIRASRSVSRRRSARRATTLTDLFGVGPVVAAMVIGHTGDVTPVREPRSLRRVHRHRTDRDELRRSDRASAVATREPPAEPCDPHRRDHPDPLRALTRPRVLRPQARRRQDETRSGPRAEASDQRRDLPTAAPRRREHGPGRASGDDSAIQRDRPRTPTAGASEEPLPDPTQR